MVGDNNKSRCPECGATWGDGLTCEAAFYQMLFWENEEPSRGEVHHLAVLAYHLQHPSLYSPEGLIYGIRLLEDFVGGRVSTEQVRKNNRTKVDSGQRQWKIRAKPGNEANYSHPVAWHITAVDVVKAGADRYVDSVRAWAQSILDDMRSCGNL